MRRRSLRGFTLIELMVVILILAILAALVVPRVLGRVEDAKAAKAKTDLSTLGAALKQFRLDCDRYPSQDEGLDALRTPPSDVSSKWHGPYIDKPIGADPWNQPYQYKFPGSTEGPDSYDLYSFGSSQQQGGNTQINEGD
jgi:general secretion pathway protein G